MNTNAQRITTQTRLGELIRHIEESHHVFTRTELNRITQLMEDADLAAVPAFEEIRRCFGALKADLEPHLMKEERILFPYISALEADPAHPPASCFGSVANPIRMMQQEHAAVTALLETLRMLTAQYRPPPDSSPQIFLFYAALAALDDDLVQHIHWEDAVLFPRALQMESGAAR